MTLYLPSTGQRNDNNGQYKVPGFGEKFIGVENQGVLQIHGERKLSWTKLEGTLSPPSYLLDALVDSFSLENIMTLTVGN